MPPRSLLLSNVFLLLTQRALAQSGPGVISLPDVPTSACVGKTGSGTATFSTEFPGGTGTQVDVYSGGYANQTGAQWKLWVNGSTQFYGVGVPGAGAPNEDNNDALKKLLKINSDGQSINFNITDESTWDNQILIEVTQQPKRKLKKVRAAAASTSATTTGTSHTSTASSGTSHASSTGSGTSKASSTAAAESSYSTYPTPTSSYMVTATGQWPCSRMPGLGTSWSVTPAPSSVATLCSQNKIPLDSDAWTEYGAQSYLSSIYTSALHAPGHSMLGIGGYPGATPIPAPEINWADALREDSGVTQVCQWNQQCIPIQCADVRGQGPIDSGDPARFLAYNSFANINNVFWQLYESMLNAISLGVIPSSGDLVKTFFTETPPAVVWSEITGTLAPAISTLSTILALFPNVFSLELRTIITVISGGIYEADALDKAVDLDKVLEQSWEADADLESMIGSYVTNMTQLVEALYNNTISQGALDYTNLTSGGAGLKNYDSQDSEKSWADTIVTNISGLFYMRAISWLLQQDNAFIIWVPYGVPLELYDKQMTADESSAPKVVKNYTNFSEDDCKKDFQGGKNGTVFTSCSAGNLTKGMGRIYSITDKIKSNTYTSAMTGWDSNYKLPGGWVFNLPDVIDGSVRSWQEGGFDFTLDNFKGNNDEALYDALTGWTNSPLQPGSFTIPVCAGGVFKYPSGASWLDGLGSVNALQPFPDAETGTTGYGTGSGATIWTQCANGYEYEKFNGTAFTDHIPKPLWSAVVANWGGTYNTQPGQQEKVALAAVETGGAPAGAATGSAASAKATTTGSSSKSSATTTTAGASAASGASTSKPSSTSAVSKTSTSQTSATTSKA